jgi:hypothetical protein
MASDESVYSLSLGNAPSRRLICGTAELSEEDQILWAGRVSKWQLDHPNAKVGGAITTIPVALHVIHKGNIGKLSASAIQAQMDILNTAFAPIGFQFSLASLDYTDHSGWYDNCDSASVEAAMKAALAIDPMTTLNFYTCGATGSGLLGWTDPPGWLPEGDIDGGVVVVDGAFPGGALAPYNEGDYAVHEFGHYVGLFHTFQGGCRGNGDYVDDTPAERNPTFGCPEGQDSCGSEPGLDPIHNYMDFTDDACQTEFTQGQCEFAYMQMAANRPTILTAGCQPAAVADFSGVQRFGVAPLTVDFTDLSSGNPASWSWTFGDGSPALDLQNPSHEYLSAGSYEVTLTITAACGTVSQVESDYVVVSTTTSSPETTSDPNLHSRSNPISLRTEILFRLPRSGRAELRVFDLRGQLLSVLGGDVMPAGHHSIRWNGTDRSGVQLASGVYIYGLFLDGNALGPAQKLSLLR